MVVGVPPGEAGKSRILIVVGTMGKVGENVFCVWCVRPTVCVF